MREALLVLGVPLAEVGVLSVPLSFEWVLEVMEALEGNLPLDMVAPSALDPSLILVAWLAFDVVLDIQLVFEALGTLSLFEPSPVPEEEEVTVPIVVEAPKLFSGSEGAPEAPLVFEALLETVALSVLEMSSLLDDLSVLEGAFEWPLLVKIELVVEVLLIVDTLDRSSVLDGLLEAGVVTPPLEELSVLEGVFELPLDFDPQDT